MLELLAIGFFELFQTSPDPEMTQKTPFAHLCPTHPWDYGCRMILLTCAAF